MIWILLAFGGAMLIGNVMALVRPPVRRKSGELVRPPKGRTIAMAVLGGIVSIWAIASILQS